jgi:hypothetical protein
MRSEGLQWLICALGVAKIYPNQRTVADVGRQSRNLALAPKLERCTRYDDALPSFSLPRRNDALSAHSAQ